MDAITLLTNDHRTVEALFARYESLGAGADAQKKQIVQEIIRELSIHAAIEEQVLYPGIRDVLSDGDELAEDAIDEHQEVKEVLAELDKMSPSDSGFDARVRSVIDDVRYHASEEEEEMFPKLASAVPKKRLEDMGNRMEKAKKIAPTRPHPMAPNTPPGNLVAGPMAAVVDRARDAVSGRSRKKTAGASSRKSSSAKKTGGRKTAAKKTTAKKSTAKRSTAKKAGGRKTTARTSTAKSATRKSSTSRKSTARKSTAKKTTARKTTSRKGTAKKSTTRKSSGRKTSSRKSTGRKSSGGRSR